MSKPEPKKEAPKKEAPKDAKRDSGSPQGQAQSKPGMDEKSFQKTHGKEQAPVRSWDSP